MAREQGQLEEAAALFREALRLAYDEDGGRGCCCVCLQHLGAVACDQNLPERAARLFGASEALRQKIGAFRDRWDVGQNAYLATRTSLGEAGVEAALTAGREMTLKQAVEFALSEGPGHQPGVEGDGPAVQARTLSPLQAEKRKYGGLTPRQREVAALIARGMTNRDIAEELVVTVRTVESHVTHILRKLGFDARTEIAGWAVGSDLADAPRTLEDQMRERG
jgi:non-specific serine/threonine protein kinase